MPVRDLSFVGVPILGQKIDFMELFFDKITNRHKFSGVILEIKLFRVLILIKFHILG